MIDFLCIESREYNTLESIPN